MLGLSDSGLDAAERMGVADALRAARHMPGRLVYIDAAGRKRFAIGGPAIKRLVGGRQFNLMRGDTLTHRPIIPVDLRRHAPLTRRGSGHGRRRRSGWHDATSTCSRLRIEHNWWRARRCFAWAHGRSSPMRTT